MKKAFMARSKHLSLCGAGFALAALMGCNQNYYSPTPTGTGSSLADNQGSPTGSSPGGTTPSGAGGGPVVVAGAPSGPVTLGTGPGTSTCSKNLQSTTENLRIIFMVDNSGSTGSDPSIGQVGTDPNHTIRTETVQTFITNYGSKTNFSYAYGYFSFSSAQLYDVSSGQFEQSVTTPFFDVTDLSAALELYDTITPNGNTPYGAAFAEVQGAIQQDEAAGNKFNYVMVFMSDGMPTDLSGSVDNDIAKLVQGLDTAAAGNGSLITISSVYFGPADPSASEHLQAMATDGGGQFLNTNNGGSILISDIITVPGTTCTP